MAVATRPDVAVERLSVAAYTIPTDRPESDGTLEWDSTTLVVVEAEAGGRTGLGYTYTDAAAATLVEETLAPAVAGCDATAPAAAWRVMAARCRNLGRPGLASAAISAVDAALWDLKARVLDVPLASLLGVAHDEVPIYGSGGFTSYGVDELREQLAAWVEEGIQRVKMKVGRHPTEDVARVAAARDAIGADAQLFVDANGAYGAKRALLHADGFAEQGVVWFEEPVSSDDLDGLRLVRERSPAGMEVAAGEYGYDLRYFERMLAAGAVDCLQADATRCGGVTGFVAVGALCLAHGAELSAHTAPALHLPLCAATLPLRHLEWFHDHVRIERMLFDGAPEHVAGVLRPNRSDPGLGLELKRTDASRYRVA